MSDNPQQGELLLEAPALREDAPFLPARMVNEYVYCPRLAYLEWVQGEWAESADTVHSAHTHRRVDREDRPLPAPASLGEEERPRTRATRERSTPCSDSRAKRPPCTSVPSPG